MAVTETSAQALLDAARELAPLIRASADEIDATRELPKPLFRAIADAGLFHMALPRGLGCPEIDLPSFIQIISLLGQADASTGWMVSQNSVYATYAVRMPPAAARAIWIDVPRSVVSNTPGATATATPVPGGYRITAQQGFSTGCRHASWVASNAQIVEDGEPRRRSDGELDARYFFVPVEEAELLDTWHVRGMRGTGTHHFALHDVFVPEERSVYYAGAPLYHDGPLYQIPRTLLFACGDASVALGVAQAALDTFLELAGSKSPRAMNGLLRDQPMVQADVGFAVADLRAGQALLTKTVQEVWRHVTETGTITMDQRAAMRIGTTHPVRLAIRVVDTLYNAAGATGIFEGHPLQRHFQDIHVISQHMQSRRTHYELVGRYHLGLSIDEARL